MMEAAKGLDHLHKLGIQHRDVKPQNLLLVGGCVAVADFGLAKLLKDKISTHTGQLSVSFAAPETIRNQVSAHSDQYSLAVTYCQLRGGRLPFSGPPEAILFGHVQLEPDLTMLPPEERPTVLRALAKTPDHRYPSCQAFIDALTRPVAPPAKRKLAYVLATLIGLVLLASSGWIGCKLFDKWRANAGGSVADASRRAPPPPIGRPPAPIDCTGENGLSAQDMQKAQEAWAKFLGRDVKETVTVGGVPITFRLIPPGKYRMGSPTTEKERSSDRERTSYVVTVRGPFDLGEEEVTQAQFVALGDSNPSFNKGDNLPVESISWLGAKKFASKLSDRLNDGYNYRLPTEEEWEYACRGGRSSAQPFGIGSGTELSSDLANFNGSHPYGGAAKGQRSSGTRAVGSYQANALGLCDMHGNVWEWCETPFTRTPGSSSGAKRVYRGGSWLNHAGFCRAAFRRGDSEDYRSPLIGFRLARTIPIGSN
jgi:formylglycine-generating enzyme required for sulfatase activity